MRLPGSVAKNIERVRRTIAAFCEKAGRSPEDVRIVAVTKDVSPELMEEALACGIRVFGENRVQEALAKMSLFSGKGVTWHFIARIQRNKLKKIVAHFHCVHSLDREDFGGAMATYLRNLGKEAYPVLVQVNLTGKVTQGGVREEELSGLLWQLSGFPEIQVVGLMTIGPQGGSEEEIRRVFRRLRELKDRVNDMGIPGIVLTELSMGMSDDYHLAVLEGATMLRLGRAIFGERRMP
ncbi:MAG: YggS family pyridoxal phosphate-dependent enzyme [Candidatus Caldatribacterium sp.]|nr:YggS family pyridoxal phosphate-dependent enzyme [Candidatus Caldatribacterium sp.]